VSIYRRGKYWSYDFIIQGNRYRGSTGLTQKTLAKESVAKLKQSVREKGAGIVRRKAPPRLIDFIPDFLREIQNLRGDDSRHKTVLFYQTNARRLMEFSPLSNAKLDQIDEQLIGDYVNWRLNDLRIDQRHCKGKETGRRPRKPGTGPVSSATINREIQTIRRLLRLAWRHKLINNLPYFQMLKEDLGRDRVVTHEEESCYLQATEQPLTDIAAIIVDCGFRPEECFRMKREDINFETGTIFIPRGKSKYARRHVPMTQRVRAILEMRIEGRGNSDWLFPAGTRSGHVSTVDGWHQKALERAGISDPFVLYSLRHTYGTRLGEAGVDAFTIQRLMGHSSITMTQRYVHPSPERVTNAVKALEALNQAKREESGIKSPQNPPQWVH